jgi:heat shock protein HtpX
MTISIALVGFIIILSDVGRRMMFVGGSRKNKNQSHPIFLLLAILVIVLGPIVAKLLQLAISRNREYLADASAVEFTRNPEGLKRALMKISRDVEELEVARAESAPMFFSSPFRHDRKEAASLFSTHPSIPSRIKRLNQM